MEKSSNFNCYSIANSAILRSFGHKLQEFILKNWLNKINEKIAKIKDNSTFFSFVEKLILYKKCLAVVIPHWESMFLLNKSIREDCSDKASCVLFVDCINVVNFFNANIA